MNYRRLCHEIDASQKQHMPSGGGLLRTSAITDDTVNHLVYRCAGLAYAVFGKSTTDLCVDPTPRGP